MSFWSRLSAPFRKKELGEGVGPMVGLIRGGGRGGRRSVQELLATYDTSPWFRAVVERVSFAAAVVPWRVFAVKPARGSREWDQGKQYCRHRGLQSGESLEVRAKILKRLEQEGRLVEITDHVFLSLLSEPNPALTGIDSRLITFALLNVVGEVAWALDLNNLGAPTGYWPVPPHWILRVPTKDRPSYTISLQGQQREFPANEIILFRNPSLHNPYGRGSGRGMTLADELETDEYVSKFQKSWFQTRGKPDLVITVKPGSGAAAAGTGGDELVLAKEQFENQYRSMDHGGGRSMWVRGDISVKELSQKLVDLDLITQRDWIKDLAREVFGVPPEIMGDVKDSNRATVSEAQAILAMLSTVPQLERMRAQIQQKLVSYYDDRWVVDYWSPVPEDREFQLKATQAHSWAVTRGEIRRLQGMEDRGEYDNVHMQPLNLVEIQAPALPKPGKAMTTRQLGAKTLSASDVERIIMSIQPIHLGNEVTPQVEETIEAWGNKILADVGVEASFDMLDPQVLNYLEDFSGQKIVGINDTTRRLVRSNLMAGVFDGEGAGAMARRLRRSFDQFDKVRSLSIAWTETNTAANFSTFTAHAVSGVVDERKWLTAIDGRERDTHRALNGTTAKIGEPFVSGGSSAMYPGGFGDPAEDIQCFPGSVMPQAMGGVDHVYRRHYSGKMIRVATEDGKQLTGTPNHPVLTLRGWVPLGLVDQSDHLVCAGLGQAGGGSVHDVDYAPMLFQQIFDFASVSAASMRLTAGVDQNFHGDGRKSEINIVPVDGELRDRIQSPILQQLEHSPLAASGFAPASLLGAGGTANGLVASRGAANGSMGFGREGSPLGGGHRLHSDGVGFDTITDFDACLGEPCHDSRAGDVESLGQRQTADALQIQSDQIRGVDIRTEPRVGCPPHGVGGRINSADTEVPGNGIPTDAEVLCNLGDGLPRGMKLSRVIDHTIFDFSDHVFNLQTAQGWYTANGVYSKNCRCTTIAVIKDPGKALAQRKAFMEEVEDDTDRTAAATRRAFDLQLADALDMLKRVA